MSAPLMKALRFLNLVDNNGSLSISNVSVYCVLAKLILTPCLSPEDVGAFLISLANYIHKRASTNNLTISQQTIDQKLLN